ncbi:MAG: hypothetical protein LDL53_12445, partial [Candidatus Hydrogenedens sp.]|nr:hypothetical protein [Candidatus Hydrogenedens sp.]
MNTRQRFSKVVFVSFTLSILFFLIGANGYGVIQISSIQDLQKIGNDAGYPLNGEYELTQDIDASDTINWDSGAGFVPIGTEANPFVGKFDGNGHKIHRLYINRSEQDNVGLFGYIGTGGEVINLGIEEGWIKGKDYTGILAGYSGGMARNCYTTGGVSGSWDTGGFVGSNDGTITQSYSMGLVSGSWDTGGFVGSNDGTITQSYSTGVVSGSYYGYVGGLVGWNDGTITQSYSTGVVSGSYYGYVGGLVGWNDGTITQSYSTGRVSGSYHGYVGGFVGWNGGTITQSYSTGGVSGSWSIGGLVGWNDYGTITQSYWDKETSGRTTSAGGTGKTTAEMKQQATFVNWDFVNVWAMVEGETYPYLQALGQPVPPPAVVEKEIWNLSDLNKIGRDIEYPIDGNYTLMVDIDASDTINWDNGNGFKPIILLGRFDGNGHVIQNLYINRPDEDYVGLFSRVGGEVKQIGLENVQIVGESFVGGLVGYNGG